MSEPVLCYVDEQWAYFTTQELSKQWGDDRNDAPYEHNAGRPYRDWEMENKKQEPRWRIVVVAFQSGLSTPSEGHSNSPYSVEQINAGHAPWLRDRYMDTGVVVHAGTPLSEFKRLIKKSGGAVYIEEV